MGSIKYMMDDITSQLWLLCIEKHQAINPYAVMVTHTNTVQSHGTWPLWAGQQMLTNSKNVAQNHPKTIWPSVWVPVTRWVWVVGTQGCSHAVTEDQVVVGLWNARGKDVATTSQLGCPATAVVPRVSGSGKPPHGFAEDSCAKPPAAAPLATHLLAV